MVSFAGVREALALALAFAVAPALASAAIACGAPVSTPTAPAATTGAAAPPAAMSADEQRARERWFAFELAAVHEVHGGDWKAFVAAKEAREARLDAGWETEAKEYSRHLHLRSAGAVRAVRVLQQEFAVVKADRAGVIAEAQRVMRLVQAGKLDELATDCVRYSATEPDRVALCAGMLEERRAELAAAVRGIDPAGLDPARLDFSEPEPEAGMTGQVLVPFGGAAPAPPDDDEAFPPTWAIELWWSGPVMPEANGPRHAHPVGPDHPSGRWRFHDIVAPYSRHPAHRF